MRKFSFMLFALLFLGCSDDGNPSSDKNFVEVKGMTLQGSSDFALWKNSEYAGSFTDGTKITINDFCMSPYETTKSEFYEIMSDKSLNTVGVTAEVSRTSIEFEKYHLSENENDRLRPVENVTWYDAVYYCNLLSQKHGFEQVYKIENIKTKTEVEFGKVKTTHIVKADVTENLKKKGFRLPTLAEWEFASRGGNPFSEEWKCEFSGAKSALKSPGMIDEGLDKTGWYAYNICNGGVTSKNKYDSGKSGYGSHQVGMKKPNGLGLYDMSGNVSEWCTDGRYQEYVNPATGKSEGFFQYYYEVGGCWSFSANYCASARIFYSLPELNTYTTGFRVCRTK